MTSGVNEWHIRKAAATDIESLKRIADAHKKQLGFIRRPTLLASIERDEVFVAENEAGIIGFVEYHHRRDAQTTLYNIVVIEEYHSQGTGRRLVDALIKETRDKGKLFIQLKCPVDLVEGNKFYEHLEFKCHATETGKHRPLNVWRLTLQ